MPTYEQDFYQWTIEQAQALRERNIKALDWDNLIEEIESLGRDYYKDCFSYAVLIIVHRLYIDYWVAQRERNQFHWQGEIDNWQTLIQNHLTTNIKNKLEKEWDTIYHQARQKFIKKTGIDTLPESCPYTLEEILE
ncbi:protein of unknown function DUF29 [Gloeothece citriformis PCC 7424]|uniref:DUF29 domain-containing protein n=1 Tax=Gloeothece citriformis (strain PCC 7424) TaxID=65393 RepID=B7K7Z9_GLOC7|nr:DUF29 domain-containing protein [Gloeothece citriformis]ACK68487.1 protein of unknown function DUF29 [Gloeothece citriformis PCC 7424]